MTTLTKEVTLNPGQSQPVSFQVTPQEVGTYSVNVDGLTGSFEAISPPIQTYTLGIYYFYLEGYEGSDDIYAWHDNWDEWCRWLVGYKANLLANYCEGDMPIEFVRKHEIPTGFDFSGWNMAKLLRTLPGYNDVDFCVAITEDNLHSGLLAFPGYHSIMLRGWTVEQEIKGMQGEQYNGEYVVSFTFTHEIGHLFRLKHCTIPPCPMSQCQITYQEWVNMGRKLWFCDTHKQQLTENWGIRNHT